VADGESGDVFTVRFGFGHFFTCAELEGLARSVGRTLAFHRDTYAHATFRPR
jgi:hypothetical protein